MFGTNKSINIVVKTSVLLVVPLMFLGLRSVPERTGSEPVPISSVTSTSEEPSNAIDILKQFDGVSELDLKGALSEEELEKLRGYLSMFLYTQNPQTGQIISRELHKDELAELLAAGPKNHDELRTWAYQRFLETIDTELESDTAG